MSIANAGRKRTKEAIAQGRAARAGYQHSEETKRKIAAAHTGKPWTDLQRSAQAEARIRRGL